MTDDGLDHTHDADGWAAGHLHPMDGSLAFSKEPLSQPSPLPPTGDAYVTAAMAADYAKGVNVVGGALPPSPNAEQLRHWRNVLDDRYWPGILHMTEEEVAAEFREALAK